MAKRKVVHWEIFKKSKQFGFPGELWDSFGSEEEARTTFKTVYDKEDFRLVRVVYEEAEAPEHKERH